MQFSKLYGNIAVPYFLAVKTALQPLLLKGKKMKKTLIACVLMIVFASANYVNGLRIKMCFVDHELLFVYCFQSCQRLV